MPRHNLETLHENHHGPKRRGELAELAFMYRASSEGISVAKPYGDSHPYDFLVQHGRRLLRIQVKSTFRKPNCQNPKQRRRFGYQVIVARLGKAGCTSYYSRDEIDFVVCFIAPLDIWYIIPVEELGHRHAIRLFPEGKGQPFGGLYEKYKEAWQLLKDDEKSIDSSTYEYTTVEPKLTESTSNSTTGG